MINGDRVKQVREIRRWTQKEMARRIGVKQSTISQIESGILEASEEIVQRIVLQTGFPLSFFKLPNTIDFPLGSLLYRSRNSITLYARSQARQYARAIFEVIKKIESNNIKTIPVRVPRLEDDSIICAIQTRSSLGLSPDSPIDNLIHTLEKNGIVVLALPITLDDIDAFSAWVGNDKRRPVIALSKNVEYGDRLRFNLAHELGHLVMHQAMSGAIRDIEKSADEFAEEFLTPKDAISKEIIRPISLATLAPLKLRWKVSIQFLIRRAFKLKKINEYQYKYLMIQISKGGKKNEPVNFKPEKPRLLGQLAEMKYGIPIDYKLLASQMSLPPHLIKETLEVHSLKSQLRTEQETGRVINLNDRRA